jgi:hypothetical protein
MRPPAIFQTVSEGVFSDSKRPLLIEHLPSSPLILAMVTVVQPATGRIMSMAYSVMVWLVEPGEQAHQEEAMQRTTTGRANAPGAASGVNEPPAFTRMVYGVYESLEEARKALSEISNTLRENEPLQITSGDEPAIRIFLIPAYRVHYVVCDYVERPMDRH